MRDRPSIEPAGELEHTFAAVVLEWDARVVPDSRRDAELSPASIERLCDHGVHFVVIDRSGAGIDGVDASLGVRPRGPGRLHLYTDRGAGVYAVTHDGPAPRALAVEVADATGALRWAASWLAQRGITGSLVLLVRRDDGEIAVPELARAATDLRGDDHEALAALLAAQLRRHEERRVPSIDADPRWVITLPEAVSMQRVAESLGTLTNGVVATRAVLEEMPRVAVPPTLAAGIYTDDDDGRRLLPAPVWTSLQAPTTQAPTTRASRVLDLRTGVLHREGDLGDLRSLRFVSIARRDAMALRAEVRGRALVGGEVLVAPTPVNGFERTARAEVTVARTSSTRGGGIVFAALERMHTDDDRRTLERLVACGLDPATQPRCDGAVEALRGLDRLGFEQLLAEHRAAWASRWADAAVVIAGAPDDELAARFALFHLLSVGADDGESAVGARGLSGPAYGGHVFWDADVFVLPVLAAIRPRAARAMLEYRLRRLPAARAAARAAGREGARFPWESADDGSDVTPRALRDAHGHPVAILTGEREEHVVADVAWAATQYVAWSGDEEFLGGDGRELLLETARYWASRAEWDGDGTAHIRGVMGPDEYHTVVDDNAYTNVMARWNLRRAAALVDSGPIPGPDDARARDMWRATADALVDGFDTSRGLHEQFAGYFGLEPLLAAQVGAPPVAADLVLGADRIAGSQVIKQADVLMLHHLVPDEVQGSLDRHLAFYEPRTAHGSSLSPAISAVLLARAHRSQEALELFRIAARMDLDDVTGTTASGLHLAAMGGVWQALAYGFLGLRPRRDALDVDPCLPAEWDALELSLRHRGARITVRADHDTVTIRTDTPLVVRIGGRRPERCVAPEHTFAIKGDRP